MRVFRAASVKRISLLSLLLLCFSIALSPAALAQSDVWGPRLLIHEEIETNYDDSGTESAATTRLGYFFVSVPNDDDVLQYINISLDSGFNDHTNLDPNAPAPAYNDVITSQPSDDWESMYVNTTVADDDTNYVISGQDPAPTINLSMTYSNYYGGTHLYGNGNKNESGFQPDNIVVVQFTATNPSTTRTLNSVTAYIYLNRDVGASSHEPHFYSASGSGGSTATPGDSDGDTYYDYIKWDGIDLAPSGSQTMDVYINITSGDHIITDTINLDGGTNGPEVADRGMNATWSGSSWLFSDITVADKFSRGPIRQGVDLSANGGYWYVRGFIRNMGNANSGHNLTYNITGWSIYEVDPSTGGPYSSANQTGTFSAGADTEHLTVDEGRVYTNNDSKSSNTTLYNTSSTSKPFIAVNFDWEVIWNTTGSETNRTYINTTMNLPTLYLVDMAAVQSASGTVSPEVGGENVTITLNMTNVGANETEPHFVQFLGYVPANTTGNDFRESGANGWSWLIHDDVKLYINGTQINNDTSGNCEIQVTLPTESSDGLVNVTIYDLASCALTAGGTVGHTFDENDELIVEYKVESNNKMTTGDAYTFYGTGQMNSSTDTRDWENFTTTDVTVSGKRIIGWKQLIAETVTMPTMINTTINLSVQDTEGTGIAGIKFMDYVPTVIGYNEFVGNFSDGSWSVIRNGTVLTYGVDYDITNNNTVSLPDGLTVNAFEFVRTNATSNTTWNLTNGEYILVSYQINFTTPGAYLLPTTIAAFDPDTGTSLSTTLYGVVKVTIPEPNVPLNIEEDELRQSKTVLVGKPVVWTKGFDVYNPNPRTVSARFETAVFDDASDGYVSYFDELGRRVEEPIGFAKTQDGKVMYWDTNVRPLENRNYEVTVLTPPILEIDRDVEILGQLPEKKVRLKMDVYLKSFAKEDYENVVLNLPITYQNIEEVRDGFGNRLPFTGGKDTASITVDKLAADELKTISVIYLESYPTIIITPDRDRYDLNSPVSLEILVINGGEKIEYPYLEVEIYTPGMDVIFTDISRLEDMDPLEKTEMYQKFVIPATAPEGNYIAQVRFREDFAVLASATGNFYVLGVEGGVPGSLEVLMVIIISVVLVYFSFRRLREARGSTYGAFRR